MTNEAGERPASFDARILAYMPGMRKLSHKLFPKDREKAQDLVTDTIIACLRSWRNYREDGGLWGFIYWAMRGEHSLRVKKDAATLKPAYYEDWNHHNSNAADGSPLDVVASVPPNQEHAAELSWILDVLDEIKFGPELLLLAEGNMLHEVSEMTGRGVTRERVRQMTTKAREELKKATKYKADA